MSHYAQGSGQNAPTQRQLAADPARKTGRRENKHEAEKPELRVRDRVRATSYAARQRGGAAPRSLWAGRRPASAHHGVSEPMDQPGSGGKQPENGPAEATGGPATPEEHLMAARELSRAGLTVAAGIAIPMLFHAVGGPGAGKMFLPMYLPILVGGMLLQPSTAALVGALTPLLSAGLTGMPPLSPPVAESMAIELAVLGSAASVCHKILRLNPWLAAILAIVASRAAFAAILLAAAPLFALKLPPLAAFAASTATSLPGIALQLAIAPPTVAAIESLRRSGRPRE